ncbi:MAG: IspD/TarI family cytidylyltransferase [Mycoplasmoidaceae bacterium]
MNIAIILSSGLSLRTKTKTPKQFLKINDKTILEHSSLKFINNKEINKLIIVIREEHLLKAKSIFKKYKCKSDFLYFCIGGNSRNESILNALNFINKNFKMNKNDIILTHDANRIFVTKKIIKENITNCKIHKCVLTGIYSPDTVYKYRNQNVTDVFDKDKLFCSQTPQTFTYEKINNILKIKNKKIFDKSDLGTLALFSNEKVFIVQGESLNFKITSYQDYNIAKKLMK